MGEARYGADAVARLDSGQSVAVLIGVTRYPRTDFPSVPAAAANVERLAAELADEALWGLRRPTRLLSLIDPDRALALQTVSDAGRLVGIHGALVIYFAGHAEVHGTNLCLAMHDSDRSHAAQTMVTVAELVEAAGGGRTDHRLLILDCCRAGRAASVLPGVATTPTRSAGWCLLGAADNDTEALAPEDGELTLFTAALLQVLRGVPGDREWLTPAEIVEAIATVLPDAHQPVHNNLAWAQQRLWVRNRRYIAPRRKAIVLPDVPGAAATVDDLTPRAPALYAVPYYLGSHPFVGRADHLASLDVWAKGPPDPVLLFQAIGGSGKSALTWEWLTSRAASARPDWAGRFWYSFYERGAVMEDFCRRALAYMTGRPISEFSDIKQVVLAELLLHQLRSAPWLLVLDGLERVLVAYHRYDAGHVLDELAGRSDEIAHRNSCSAIRPGDDELLRQLATAAPSRIVITSRLTPRILLNPAHEAIPGVRVNPLPGLRPSDAEALMRACGVRGQSGTMQDFLSRHCGCHPLVTGVVAGLVNNYLAARGEFDRWAADPHHGGRLNLGGLNLVMKRSHILSTALATLPPASGQLLSALSLLPDEVDYSTLAALNPHLPSQPRVIPFNRTYDRTSKAGRHESDSWKSSPEFRAATEALTETVRDLENRGLVQYDRLLGRWDLHPVVRATARDRLGGKDRNRLSQRIIDHFSQQAPETYTAANALDDLHDVLTVVRTMLGIGRFNDAASTLTYDLADALLFNLEAYAELVALAKPMFKPDWSAPISGLLHSAGLANKTANALNRLELFDEALNLCRYCVEDDVRHGRWHELRPDLGNLGRAYASMGKLSMAARCATLAVQLAEAIGEPGNLLAARDLQLTILGILGRWAEARKVWKLIQPMSRYVPRQLIRPGTPEASLACYVLLPTGTLTQDYLTATEKLLIKGNNRNMLRAILCVSGQWRLDRDEPELAAEPLAEAVQMANEAGFPDRTAEAWLALARLRTAVARPDDLEDLAERLASGPNIPHEQLAELWRALGEKKRAITHAHAAYREAWADGEPYVNRSSLTRSANLLHALGESIPTLRPYDAAKYTPAEWERLVADTISDQRRVWGSNG